MENQVNQIQNSDGTFQYLINGKIQHKNSKKDYSFCIVEVGAFSSSLKNIENQLSYLIKYGNPKSINFDNLEITKIQK